MQLTKKTTTTVIIGTVIFCMIFTAIYWQLSDVTVSPEQQPTPHGELEEIEIAVFDIAIAVTFASLAVYVVIKLSHKNITMDFFGNCLSILRS